MSSLETLPKVFIIESLEIEDEENGYFEGGIISDILRLSNVECKYYYIRTKKEFKKVIELFKISQYRYLHISCHGGDNSIWTTYDGISYEELGQILQDVLYNKRLFLSACSAVNSKMAKAVIPNTNCYSIIGPEKDIAFRDAAIMWASFYHLMFNHDSEIMLRKTLLKNLNKVVNTFNQPIQYFSKSKRTGIKSTLISPESD